MPIICLGNIFAGTVGIYPKPQIKFGYIPRFGKNMPPKFGAKPLRPANGTPIWLCKIGDTPGLSSIKS